jgi:hypothetical protein
MTCLEIPGNADWGPLRLPALTLQVNQGFGRKEHAGTKVLAEGVLRIKGLQ